MGGNLFRFLRMPRERYIIIDADVRRALCAHVGVEGVDWAVPRWYGDKADFGDMDVLLAASEGWLDRREALMRALLGSRSDGTGLAQDVLRIGGIVSMPVQELQVDLFSFAPDMLDAAWSFMCFNDLGNLVGRIARGFNAKFGDTGLSYVWRSADGGRSADVPLTHDFRRICAFLDLDHAAWLRGFPTRASLFEWIVASRFFSVVPYLDDTPTRAHVLRRNKGRTTITAFGDWLQETRQNARPALVPRGSDEHVFALDCAFPEARLHAAITAHEAHHARACELRSRFSGDRVMQLRPGLRGRALGEFMASFRRSRPDFEAWLLAADQNDIDAAIVRSA